METEFRNISKDKADIEAINSICRKPSSIASWITAWVKKAFWLLILVSGRAAKLFVSTKQGNFVHNETIYPHPPQNETAMSIKKILSLVNAYKIEAIAIGNGTASRETEDFIKWVKFENDIQVFVVSEAGASIYSASKIARDEFPDYDVTVRGAVSIGQKAYGSAG